MQTVLIISPDLEMQRMLELAFDLNGFEVSTAADANGLPPDAAEAKAIIYDVVEDTVEQWKSAKAALAKTGKPRLKKAAKTAVILPRSYKISKLPKELAQPDIVIRRPFELFDFVKRMADLAGKTRISSPRKSSSSRRKARRRS